MEDSINTNSKLLHQLHELYPILLILIYSFKFGRLLPYGLSWGGLFTDWESEILSLLPLFVYLCILILVSYRILKLYLSKLKRQFFITVLFSFLSVTFFSHLSCVLAAISLCAAIVLSVCSDKNKERRFYLIKNLFIYTFSTVIVNMFEKFIFQDFLNNNQLIYLIVILLGSFIFSAACIALMIFLFLLANNIKDDNFLNYEIKLAAPDYLKDLFCNLKKSTLRMSGLIVICAVIFFAVGILTTFMNRQYLVTQDTENINAGDYIATTVVIAESKDYYCVQSGIIRSNGNNNPTLSISSKSFRWISKEDVDVYNVIFQNVEIESDYF